MFFTDAEMDAAIDRWRKILTLEELNAALAESQFKAALDAAADRAGDRAAEFVDANFAGRGVAGDYGDSSLPFFPVDDRRGGSGEDFGGRRAGNFVDFARRSGFFDGAGSEWKHSAGDWE